MKRSLLFKLILCYIILISIFYLVVNCISSLYLDDYLYNNVFNSMEKHTETILNSDVLTSYYNDEISYDELCTYFETISAFIPFSTWITNSDMNIIYDSSKNIDTNNEICIINFNEQFFSTQYHKETIFKDISEQTYISYNHEILNKNGDCLGYIILISPSETVNTSYNDLILHINFIALLMFPIAAIVFILIYFLTIEPVHRITKYAVEYSRGKLGYKLIINTNDEYKQLSDAIEYMVGELNNLDEYQRKFIGNISHDFRSPLTSIKGYIEAMLDGTIPVENQQKYMKIILFESERLTDLTTNLLTLNNFDNNKKIMDKRSFDINSIISKTVAVYEGRCSKNKIELVCNFENGSQYVFADQSQIQQVINNLLDNAIKFSPHYSKIVLSTFVRNEKVFVSVKDSGSGIPKNAINRIWERFYKTDPSRGKDKKGTGLGLAITKEIINAHHENINVVSTEGVGTEFIFSLSKPTIKP